MATEYDSLVNNSKKFGTELYRQLMEPSSPYVSYNNVDRFLNVAYRFYTTGKLASMNERTGNLGFLDQANSDYELRTNVMSQYYWGSTAWLGAAYALHRPALFSSTYQDHAIAVGVLSRAIINLVLESALLVANGIRYSRSMVATRAGDRMLDQADPNPINLGGVHLIINGGPPVPVLDGNNNPALGPRNLHVPLPAGRVAFVPAPGMNLNLATGQGSVISRLMAIDYRPAALIKNLRSYAGTIGSGGFALNAAISLALQSTLMAQVVSRNTYKGNERDVAIAAGSFGVLVGASNLVANSLKALDSFGKTVVDKRGVGPEGFRGEMPATTRGPRFTSKTTKRLGIAGTTAGLIHGVAGIMQFVPYLFSSELTSHQKGVIVAEIALQAAGGLTQVLSNIWLAQSTARNHLYLGRLAGPSSGAALGALMVAMSPLEIYALSMQSQYADQLKELGQRLGSSGYQGNSLMGDFYHEKTKAEGGLLAATTALGLIGSAVTVSLLSSGVGAPAAVVVGLAVGIINGVFKGVEQIFLEDIVEKYVEKIQAEGGSRDYFGKELVQQYDSLFENKAFADMLKSLQSRFSVDSVVAVTRIEMSPQAAQWAAVTRLGEDIITADSRIARFRNGVVDKDDRSTISLSTGMLTLAGAAGQKQLLTFLQPLLAPGEEVRTRKATVGKSSATTLRIIPPNGVDFDPLTVDKAGWTINDGDASTTMDLSQVVTHVTGVDKKPLLEVPLTINGAGGDDTVLANTSRMVVDGGEGNDVVDYSGLKGDVRLTVKATANGVTVTKVMRDAETVHETTQTANHVNGKATNTFETREFEVSKVSATETDTLTNFERVIGSNGKDTYTVQPPAADGSPATDAGRNYVFDGGGGDDVIGGGDGNDILLGGAGSDTITGGKGDDFILQDIGSGKDTIDGGAGIDTVNYGITNQAFKAVRETVVNVGARGRFIRIYHTQTSAAQYNAAPLSLAGLKVYAGGIDRAVGKTSRVGADVQNSGGTIFGTPDALERNENNDGALTDGKVGAGAPLASAKSNYLGASQPYAKGLYIELDLGAEYDIDSLALWGRSDAPGQSEGLQVYVSRTAFPGEKDTKKIYSSNDYFKLSTDSNVKKFSVARVETVDNTLSLAGAGARGIVADLSQGTVVKTLDGTQVSVNAVGRYIRIYHVQPDPYLSTPFPNAPSVPVYQYNSTSLSLADLKVYVGGVDVAQRIKSGVGADQRYPIYHDGAGGPSLNNSENSDTALTDGIVGSGAAVASVKANTSLNEPVAHGLYIDLDLGYKYAIDTIALWGRADKPEESNNLRIYVSDTPFPANGSQGAYYDLASKNGVNWFDAAQIEATPRSTVTDTLIGIENLIGTAFDDSITGDDNDNTLVGGAGKDRVMAGKGADRVLQNMEAVSDTLDGGDDTDTLDYSENNMAGGIQADLGAGTVTKVLAGTSANLGAMGRYIRIYHNDAVSSLTPLSVTGLKAYAGGVDVAAGRPSLSSVDGGNGSYTNKYGRDNPSALTDGALGGTLQINASGKSNLASSNNYSAGRNYIELDLGDIYALDSISLWGNASNPEESNNLRVYVSSDPFRGAGNTNLDYDNLAIKQGVAKADLKTLVVDFTQSATDTAQGFEKIVGTGFADVLTGDDKDNDTLEGQDGDDILWGGNGNDTLNGGAGNDTLDGGAGSNGLNGGTGDDTFIVNSASDTVVEFFNEGTDTVQSSITYTLTAHVENLTLTGSAAINGTGNALNNVIKGNSGVNTLQGLDGDDEVQGGDGDDALDGGNGYDWLTGGAGRDVLRDGGGGASLWGGDGDDQIFGSPENGDYLQGDDGDDWLNGGGGNDSYNGGKGSDTYVFTRKAGRSLIWDGSGTNDTVTFQGEIWSNQIWLRRVNDALEISVIGASNKVTVENWYLGSQYRVEQIRTTYTSDNKVLRVDDVDKLVQAMAAFSPPAAGQTILPANYYEALAPALAANWR